MSDRWKLGTYEFVINPNSYGEDHEIVGDSIRTLDGTLYTQPTAVEESYHLSSVFFQHRPRVLTEVSISKGDAIEIANGKFYILDKAGLKVDVYSLNLATLQKSISMVTTPNGQNLVAFDVQEDETVWAVEPMMPNLNIHKVKGTTRTITPLSNILGDVVGIKYLNGFLWITTNARKLYKVSATTLQVSNSLDLPTFDYGAFGYRGMTAFKDYLIIAYGDGESCGAYYVDSENGSVCNHFALPENRQLGDVAFDGKNFVFLVSGQKTVVYASGNTVLLDIYDLEKQIRSKGFLEMKDDMGVTRRVMINDYSVERVLGNQHRYTVSMRATKVDRGIN